MASTTSRRGWASGRPPAAWVQAGGGSSASSSVHSGSEVSEGERRLRWLGWGVVGVAVTGHTGGGAPGRLVGLVAQVATRSPVCGANRQAPRRHRNRATLRQGRPAHRFRNRHLEPEVAGELVDPPGPGGVRSVRELHSWTEESSKNEREWRWAFPATGGRKRSPAASGPC